MNYSELYSKQDKTILKIAEDSLNPRIDRLDEIVAYCKQAKISSIGIANCVSFNREAENVSSYLEKEGFNVEKVHCKIGKVKFTDLVPDYKGISCNPAGQASYLAEKKTELNIMMGLCLGHDMIFNAKSKAPVTPLVVKDRKLKHKTVDILNHKEN